jgi:hypothetical protein
MEKMNIDKVSDEEMQDLFTESFESVGSENDIGEFECSCKRVVGGKDDGIYSLEVITISREDKGSLDFARNREDDYVLNTNDYVIAYKSE